MTDSNILIWDFIEQKYLQAFLTSINKYVQLLMTNVNTINTTGTWVHVLSYISKLENTWTQPADKIYDHMVAT